MTSIIVDALRYWVIATLYPRRAIVELKSNTRKVAISFWINFIFAVMYTVTVVIYIFIGRLPAIDPWVPVAKETYYVYQAFWTIPWGLATWVMISGIADLLASTGQTESANSTFENALMVCAIGWVVPNWVLMWIPETLLVPIWGAFWPSWVEILRLMVLPPLWQSVIIAIGLRETHSAGLVKGFITGMITVCAFFIMFLAFMR
jgi:hypothetical protein